MRRDYDTERDEIGKLDSKEEWLAENIAEKLICPKDNKN